MLKSTTARFIDHVFAGQWGQFVDDIVPFLAADEQSAHGSCVTDPETGGIEAASM